MRSTSGALFLIAMFHAWNGVRADEVAPHSEPRPATQQHREDTDWTYNPKHFGLSVKWRQNLESNLRWMIARQCAESEASAAKTNAGPPAQVAVFADAGAWHLGTQSVVHALETDGVRCRVLDRSRINQKSLRDVQAFIAPGGYSFYQKSAAGDQGMGAIRNFVSRGGRYLGICAGAYLASKDVLWEGSHYPYPLEFFDGTAEGAVDEIAKWPDSAGVALSLTEAGRKFGLTGIAEGNFYYKGGPRFLGGTDYTVLGNYSDGTPAMIARRFGQGDVCLTGIHFERPAPLDAGDDAPSPPTAGAIFRTLLKLKQPEGGESIAAIDRAVAAPIEVRDLAHEDRLNLERNLRWILARRETSSTTASPKTEAAIGVYADAGAEHASVVRVVESPQASGASARPLLYSDLTTDGLAQVSTLIFPTGEPRVMRDAIGAAGAKAIERFTKLGGTVKTASGQPWPDQKSK
jgi:glutamine amidotransferase-like uncharacterized protein